MLHNLVYIYIKLIVSHLCNMFFMVTVGAKFKGRPGIPRSSYTPP